MIDPPPSPLVRFTVLAAAKGERVRGRLWTGIVITTAITAAVVVYVFVTLPRSALTLEGNVPETHLAGAYHIHSRRSDGTGTVDDIAQAASRAGLRFIILTDHGDATRPPDAPTYRHGVLVIDAVEINTRDGHVVALGLEHPSPYPLAGLAQDVIDDIHRQGGVAILAHPDSPREELAWRGGPGAPADGVEWINADSEWRDETVLTLVRTAAHAAIRPVEAIASMFSRPSRSLQRWDNAARVRATVGLAAVDAHANVPWREQEEPRQSDGFERPSYETMFRTLVQTVVVDRGPTGDARADAVAIVSAIISGRTYSTVRAYAWPSALEFTATRQGVTHEMGDRLGESPEPVTFAARVVTAPGIRLTLLRNGQPHRTGQGTLVAEGVSSPGVYRIEAHVPGIDAPWIVSNPITVDGNADDVPLGGRGRGRGRGEAPSPGVVVPQAVDPRATQWTIEQDPLSTGRVGLDGARVRFDYRLGDGLARGQYAALVYSPVSNDGVQTVNFVASASVPMRLSIQVRLPEGRGRTAQRWRKSIFVDQTPTPVALRLQDFEPADRPTVRRPIVTPIQSLLFVVDTVNGRPGTTGTVWLSDVALGVNRLE
jgi:hypothetical protein